MAVNKGHNLGHWWLVLTVVTTFSYSLATQKYTTEELCFHTVVVNRSNSVTIEFNSGFNKLIFDYECRIRVESQNMSRRLQFRFLEFYFGTPCPYSNVTVFDGDIYKPVVQGLRTTLCGRNSTLTSPDTMLTSEGNYVTVVFRRNDFAVKTDSTFHIQFTSFHDGPCQEDAEEYTCNNSRCIDKALRCQELNPCGDNSDCTDLIDINRILEQIFNYIKEYIGYIAIFIGVCILWRCCSAWKRKHGEYPIIGQACKCRLRRRIARRLRRHTHRRTSRHTGIENCQLRQTEPRPSLIPRPAVLETTRGNNGRTSAGTTGLSRHRRQSLTDTNHSDDWLENEADYLEPNRNSREPYARRSPARGETRSDVAFPTSPRDGATGYSHGDNNINVTFPTAPPHESTSLPDTNSNLPTIARHDVNNFDDAHLPPSYDEVTNASSPHAPPPSYHDVIANKDRYVTSTCV